MPCRPHGSRGGGGEAKRRELWGLLVRGVFYRFPWPKVRAFGMAPTRPSAGRCSLISTGCWLRSGVALSLSGSASMRPGTPPPPMPLHHTVLIGYSALPRPSWTLQRPWQGQIALRRRKALLRSSSQSFKRPSESGSVSASLPTACLQSWVPSQQSRPGGTASASSKVPIPVPLRQLRDS